MSALPASYGPIIAEWAATRGTPGLEDDVSVAFSRRLRSSLGRCRPALARITLRADLHDGPAELLTEVLCHELAHVAAYRLHGRAIQPHGRECKALMAAAGSSRAFACACRRSGRPTGRTDDGPHRRAAASPTSTAAPCARP